MSPLRSVRLALSLILCASAALDCAGTSPRPAAPEAASSTAPRSALSSVTEASAWSEAVPGEEPADKDDDDFNAQLAQLSEPPRWAYSGDLGPDRWGELGSEYAPCKNAEGQSPIDIATRGVEADRALELIDFGYDKLPVRALNDGRTIQVTSAAPAAINAAGATWKLTRMQLHSPSEHSIDGRFADLEVQLYHEDAVGEISVVSLLFKQGNENRALAPLFDHLPAEGADPLAPAGAAIDLWGLLPSSTGYFAYTGSLTTPACTEGVRWFVLQAVGQVSREQLAKLRAVSPGDTRRPVQPLGTRKVTRPL